jgi:hypothetical protein
MRRRTLARIKRANGWDDRGAFGKASWSHRIRFTELIAEMMESDLQRAPRARQRYGPA